MSLPPSILLVCLFVCLFVFVQNRLKAKTSSLP